MLFLQDYILLHQIPVKKGGVMGVPIRVKPQEIASSIKKGQALLVCAYDSEEKFKMFHLDGAISLSEFESRLPSLPKEHELIFYCA